MENTLKLKDILSLPWSILKRFEFIEFRLFWEERINRMDLIETFKISVPQASSDFSKYQELAPENMLYDKKNKYYYPSQNFNPLFAKPSSEQYLLRYIALELGIYQPQNSFLGFIPPVGSVPIPWRRVEPILLKTIVGAIRDKLAIEIEYQSMSRSEKLLRWITPHALGFDGYRWHCRAFCHIDNKFKDFNLGRIWNIYNEKISAIDANDDLEWHSFVKVKIGPNPDLVGNHKKVIEYEYGMKDGETSIEVRQSMLFYLLTRLGFNIKDHKEKIITQHIVLLNKDDIDKIIDR